MQRRITEPNVSLRDPRAHPWQTTGRAELIEDGRQVKVTYTRGVVSEFHHAEAALQENAIIVTVFLGQAPWLTKRVEAGERGPFAVTAVGIVETVVVELPEEARGRPILDGAPNR